MKELVITLAPLPEWVAPHCPQFPHTRPPRPRGLLTMSISLVRELTRSETEERGSVRRSDSS